MELPKNPTRKLKQSISVPFIWEKKPGIPKNDWKPVKPSRPPPPPLLPLPPHPQIKLLTSVPFEWEKKPRKPVPSFPQPMREFGSKDENSSGNRNGGNNGREMIFETDFESFNFQTDNPFNVIPSQLANGLVPPPPHIPTKLSASIPFDWEEKPGKLPSFPQPKGELENKNENDSGNKDGTKDEREVISESVFESFNFQTDELFNSVPSQLADGLVPRPPHPTVKLIAPNPFDWGETQGKALPSYPLSAKEFEIHCPPTNSIPSPSPLVCSQSDENRTGDEREMIFKADFETFSFKTDEPLSSVPSPQANPLEPPPPSHPSIRLSVSIPFEWEEKPGKPLPSFPLPSPTNYSQCVDENDTGHKNGSEEDFESDFETLSFHTDESSSSIPSLMAKHTVPCVSIANAIPFLETPPSPPGYESDSSTKSNATGTTSLVGAPFLEHLFPLLSPKFSFLEKVGCSKEHENSSKDHKKKLQSKDLNCESSFSVTVRRPTTLGELIMMRRRTSYTKKDVHIRRHNSLGSTKKREMGCFTFGINDRIEGLQRKMKRHLQLKLI